MFVEQSKTKQSKANGLADHLEGGTRLDLVAGVLVLNDNATLRRIARATSTVDKESGATAHAVAAGREQLVAVGHTLEGKHVAEGVCTLGQRADTHFALARWVVTA